jgi:hypothetical protein
MITAVGLFDGCHRVIDKLSYVNGNGNCLCCSLNVLRSDKFFYIFVSLTGV